jgi:hypothetical protein
MVDLTGKNLSWEEDAETDQPLGKGVSLLGGTYVHT